MMLHRRLRLVHLVPSLRCNMACPYCYTSAGNRAVGFAPEKLRYVCAKLNDLAFECLHLEGGEPFADEPGLATVVETLLARGRVQIVTNGTLLPERLFSMCCAKGFTRFIVSVDGNKLGHRWTRGNTYDIILRNLQLMLREGCSVAISCTVHGRNVVGLSEMFDELISIGVQDFRIGDVIPVGRARSYEEWLHLQSDHHMLLLHEIVNLPKDIPVSFSLQASRISGSFVAALKQMGYDCITAGCHSAKDQFCVTSEGDLYGCYNLIGFLRRSEHPLNLFECCNFSEALDALEATATEQACPVYSGGHFFANRQVAPKTNEVTSENPNPAPQCR